MSTSVSLQGRELIAAWNQIDRSIAAFVLQLAEFDASGAWAEDGYASCVSWLVGQCNIGFSTAKEKVRVSHELTRRHVVRAAFEDGLAYSKVRLLVRLDGIDHERDAEYVQHALMDSVRVVEERVNNYNLFATQDRPPSNIDDHYGIFRQRGFGGGMGRIVMEGPDDMLDGFMSFIDGYGEFLLHNAKPEQLNLQPVDKAAVQPYPQAEAPRPRAAQRLDWLFDMLKEAQLADPKKLDPYNTALGVTIQYEDLMAGTGYGLSDQGTVLSGETVRRLCCDAGIHRIVVKGASEILDFGREARLFNRAQRRAIRFRHGHRCAVRGCGRRITEIHHLTWWEEGGETNIDNGIPLCSYHHHLVHEGGWTIAWNPVTAIVRLEGPRGQLLESEALFRRAAA